MSSDVDSDRIDLREQSRQSRDSAIEPSQQHPKDSSGNVMVTVAARTVGDHDPKRGDLLLSGRATSTVPREIQARDSAMVRTGADFKRRLRRALNDDQSEVLDRIRNGRGEFKVDELPSYGDQVDHYFEPLAKGLRDASKAGARAAGKGKIETSITEELVEACAKCIVDIVRIPVTEIVASGNISDREAILDPIRASYRSFRNGDLEQLATDALNEAFAQPVRSVRRRLRSKLGARPSM